MVMGASIPRFEMIVVECFTKFPRHEEESPWVFSRATARSPHVHGHSRAPTTFTVISRALQRALVCRCGPSTAFRMPGGLRCRRGLSSELTPQKKNVPGNGRRGRLIAPRSHHVTSTPHRPCGAQRPQMRAAYSVGTSKHPCPSLADSPPPKYWKQGGCDRRLRRPPSR